MPLFQYLPKVMDSSNKTLHFRKGCSELTNWKCALAAGAPGKHGLLTGFFKWEILGCVW